MTQFGHLLARFTPNQQLELIQMRLEKAGSDVNAVVFQIARILLGIFFGGLVYGLSSFGNVEGGESSSARSAVVLLVSK